MLEHGVDRIPPIVVRVHDGKALIVEGHHRLEAFRQLGYERVPIKYVHSNQLGKIRKDGYTYYRTLEELLNGMIK
ncbi:MAG: ParB N-terminal domain-containing protein [Oscillospiraceae bacterium]|nr:ParB N-terminal domain-containing protein [Oscillospiraceae bacterium]